MRAGRTCALADEVANGRLDMALAWAWAPTNHGAGDKIVRVPAACVGLAKELNRSPKDLKSRQERPATGLAGQRRKTERRRLDFAVQDWQLWRSRNPLLRQGRARWFYCEGHAHLAPTLRSSQLHALVGAISNQRGALQTLVDASLGGA